MPHPQTEELSQFEKQRLANIAERDALLKKLTLEAQSSGLFSKPSPKPGKRDSSTRSRPKKKATPRVKKEENEAPIVRRMSSRLRGLTADSEVAKRKADEAFEEVQKVEREKRLRKSDFFTLDNMLVSGQKLTGDALIGIDVVTKGVAKPYERTFGDEDVKKTTDKDLKALREEMSSLELWDQWTPGRTLPVTCRSQKGRKLVSLTRLIYVYRHQSHTGTYLYNDIPPI
jgi:WD repeat-containing protein 76